MTDACIHKVFEAIATSSPTSVAITAEYGTLTYGELNERAERIARFLRSRGVQQGTYVALCMNRSTELILGMLGVLRAGGAYVPVDPGYPKERLRFMLDEVDSPIVLASAETIDLLPENGASAVICLDRDRQTIESVQGGLREGQSETGEADPACVIFTSGSTGTPKGVIVPHRGIVDLVVNANYIDLVPSDRVAHVSNVGFDAASFEIWGALLNGAQLVIIPGRISSEPRELAPELRRHEISVLLLTTALFELLAAWNGGIFGGVRHLIVGGDVVNPQWMRKVLTSGQAPERLLHVYGPTECATFATGYLVTNVPEDAARIPIGWPISNTTAYVFDRECKPVPIGTPGELCLGGPRLAIGYLHQPELTREKFIHVAFGDGRSERIYRTGDLVKCLPDSSIEFIGRIDRQMKIRGYRVEPAEIEGRLNAHPSIASSVVMARRDPSGQASLVAFFLVRKNQSAPSPAELLAHLSVTLPDYMLPSVFVQKSEWPLSAHGKIDRDALLETLRANRQEDETASSGAKEEALRELCRKAIGASFLGLDESLIARGLHSLSAANLAWMIEEKFNVRLKLSEILDNPSIAGILALVEERQNGDGQRGPRPEVRAVRPRHIPPSFAQEQIWFLERLHPHLNSYRFQSLFHFRGVLDVDALEATLNSMVRRHEVLRTVLLSEDQVPRQEIRPHVPFCLRRQDLRGVAREARQSELDRLIHEELRRPFDLETGPLIRWQLFQFDDDDFKLLHTEHHCLHDGWGYAVLLAELYATYEALSEKKNSALLPDAVDQIQFADFALWQRDTMASGAWDHQLAFWKEELAGCPAPPTLPSDRRIGVSRAFAGSQIRHSLAQALWDELGAMCSREGVTRFAWLHAAFQLFIHRYTGAEDFCVGSGFANRRDPRLRGMLGMVINTLPIRARFAAVTSFRDLAQRASRALRRASDNQELPFERVVQAMNPHREANANPFFNTCIGAYEDAFPHFRTDRLEVTSDDAIACGQVKFDLMALLIPPKHGPVDSTKSPAPLLLWEFSTELFDVSTGQRMLDHFLCLVESSLRQPNAPLAHLPLMSKDEEERVLRLGQGPSPSLGDSRVHAVFDQVARSFSDAVAVEWEGGALSYGELNERASALARYLRAQGVANGVRVGLCMDRSAEMIIGMLGTLKAGGTYVPFDPAYPSERLDFMQKDAETVLILSIERFAESVANIRAKVILLDRDQSLVDSFSGQELPDSSAPNDLAYVIFTSGSTGQPKGVAVSHQAIVRLVINTNYVSLGPEDRVAHLSNVCFDAATFEIWGALLNGGRILVISKSTVLEPRLLAAELERGKVSTIFLTTALFNEMAAEDGGIFKDIKQVLFGGEAADAHWVRCVLTSGGAPKRLLNMYGPTECTTFATFHLVTHVEESARNVPIGRPISNTTAYVLDGHGNPGPIGVPGELYVGGPGVAEGYLNRPELTRERFVPDPFGGEKSQRLYRTGDIVKYLPDGNIEFIRRADTQTKIRGFRIEPGEIEAVLKAHPEVENAVVVAREERSGQRELVGYVVARSDEILTSWRSYLEEKLPFYMIPSRLVRVPELPTTPSGKIDRLALPKPERPIEGEGAVLSPFEEMVALVWSEVLDVKAVAPQESFFELGGHSLLAARVVSQLRIRFGVEIPLRAVFDNPSLAELGRFIATWQGDESNASEPRKDVLREEALL